MSEPTLVFSTPAYGYMGDHVCALGEFEPGALETRLFPDGERYQRIACDVAGRDVVVIGGTISDTDTLRIYDLACALVKYRVRTLTLVMPYYGYQTMERALVEGEVVTAKTRARLFSAIPSALGGNRVVLMDLHASGIPYYFEDHIRAVHVYARPVILEAARKLGGDDFTLACTDAGRAKWVQNLANHLGVPAAFVLKRRLGDSETEVSAVSANVQGRRVVLYDDMIRSGSSLIGAAQAYLEAGAASVAALATHGVFPNGALARIQDSGLFTEIGCTDTHPRARELEQDGLEVFSVAGLLAEWLRAEHFE